MTIEVFKTDIADEWQAKKVTRFLQKHFPLTKINVDLHDCDNVLRMEGIGFTTHEVIMLVNDHGVVCSVID